MKNIIRKYGTHGKILQWEHEEGDMYIATGRLINGKRFRPITGSSWRYISNINLFRGTYWCKPHDSAHRVKITEIYN